MRRFRPTLGVHDDDLARRQAPTEFKLDREDDLALSRDGEVGAGNSFRMAERMMPRPPELVAHAVDRNGKQPQRIIGQLVDHIEARFGREPRDREGAVRHRVRQLEAEAFGGSGERSFDVDPLQIGRRSVLPQRVEVATDTVVRARGSACGDGYRCSRREGHVANRRTVRSDQLELTE